MAENYEVHIALDAMWNYRAKHAPLDADQLSHLYGCDDCLALLGVCQISNSMAEAHTLRDGKPRTGKTN